MEKVNFRKLKMSDLDRICELFIDDRILRGTGFPGNAKDVTKNGEIKWLKKRVDAYKEKKPQVYNLGIDLGGKLIGTIGINKADYVNKNCEIGDWLGVDYWGKGYGTWARKKFTKLIIKKFGFVRIYGLVFEFNKRSQRAIEKAGYKLEGKMKKSKWRQGRFVDERIYAYVR